MADSFRPTDTMANSNADVNGNITKDLTSQKDEVKETRDYHLSNRYRYSKTAVLFVVYACVGMTSKILGTSMLDLIERVNTNYEGMSQAISLLHPCRAGGALVTGFFLDRFPHYDDLALAVATVFYGSCVIITPWARTVDVLGAVYAVQGLAMGGTTSTCNYAFLRLWTTKAPVVLNAAYCFSTIGMFAASLLMLPFLGSLNQGENNATGYDVTKLAGRNSTTEDANWKPSRIEIPYGIIGGIFASTGIILVLLYFTKTDKIVKETATKENIPLKSLLNPASCAEGNCVFGTFMCFGIILFSYCARNSDEILNGYLMTYAVESGLAASKQDAALLDSMQALAQCASRALVSILSFRVSTQYTFFPFLLSSTVCWGCLCYFGTSKRIYLWVFAVSSAFFYGPTTPAGLSFLNNYMVVSGILCALFDISSALGGLSGQLISGILLQYHGPQYILYFAFVSIALATFFTLLMYSAGCWRGDRKERAKRRARAGEWHDIVNEVVISDKS